jgi:hypothetical protein
MARFFTNQTETVFLNTNGQLDFEVFELKNKNRYLKCYLSDSPKRLTYV